LEPPSIKTINKVMACTLPLNLAALRYKIEKTHKVVSIMIGIHSDGTSRHGMSATGSNIFLHVNTAPT
jgi:hypothetical protein